jgi:hypothetical protein
VGNHTTEAERNHATTVVPHEAAAAIVRFILPLLRLLLLSFFCTHQRTHDLDIVGHCTRQHTVSRHSINQLRTQSGFIIIACCSAIGSRKKEKKKNPNTKHVIIMKFASAVIGLLVAASSNMDGVAAFSPKGYYVPSKSGLMVPSSTSSSSAPATDDSNPPLWRSGMMRMVAGGAERSYGQEYYEGECRNWLYRSAPSDTHRPDCGLYCVV